MLDNLRRLLRPVTVVCTLALSSTAFAGVQRTFVASTGNDVNPCSLAQPCRQFAAAVARTNAGGEVIVLDSAGYGPVSIAQSITITAPPGVYGGISVFTGDGIDVDGIGITVTLRGLTITSQGGTLGIHFVNGAMLHVENCEISGFLGLARRGISVDAPAGTIHVIDTVIRDNQNGIVVAPWDDAHTISGLLSRVRLENNVTEGILLNGSAQFGVEDSVVAGSQYNIDVYNLMAGAHVHIAIARTTIQRGGYGIYLEPNATGQTAASITDTTITDQSVFGIAAIPLCAGCNAMASVTRTAINSNNVGIMCDAINGGPGSASVIIDSVTSVYNASWAVKAKNQGTIYTRQNNTVTILDTIGGSLGTWPGV